VVSKSSTVLIDCQGVESGLIWRNYCLMVEQYHLWIGSMVRRNRRNYDKFEGDVR